MLYKISKEDIILNALTDKKEIEDNLRNVGEDY
jgi:hypothetical protein